MCATTKYVSDTWMSNGITASMIPLMPPKVNIVMNPSANRRGVLRWIPPLDGSKKWVPSVRSNSTKNCDPAMNGVAMTTSSDVVKFAHTSSGMRQNVIPGARMVMMVTRKLSAVAIDDAPASWMATLKNVCPSGWTSESGAYEVQPVANEPPGARKLAIIMMPAVGSSQYERAFRRGNAMSGAPIISGIT